MAKNMKYLSKTQTDYPVELPANLWPDGFRHLYDPPKNIWIRGNPLWQQKQAKKLKFVCLIGSRSGTKYGYDICKTLVAGLKEQSCVIVSGLALGIDGEAHRNAIALNIPCVAIPGSGLSNENIYPKEHTELAKDILFNGGALLSELTPDTKAAKWTFPRRNRLMAAMSDIIVVIEAGERSGTYITALQALELGKTLGAVPGPIDSPMSKGANRLIKEGAFPITCGTDILELIS